MPASFLAGSGLVLALGLGSAGAPVLATSHPWLARGESGWRFPALAALMGRAAPAGGTPVLRAPIPHDPFRIDLGAVLEPPSRRHMMGTDGLGRDLGSRLAHGGRVSLAVGLLAAALAVLVGVPLGAIAGYRGGAADAAVSRALEAVLCIPSLLLVLALIAAAPPWLNRVPEALRIALVLGAVGWTPVARYVRGEFLKLRTAEMVLAARAAGASDVRIATRHVLPSALAPVLVTAAFAVGAAILMEAALSFLGLGVHPPTPTWGGMLTEARFHVDRAWWLAVFPGLALFLAVLACNLIGEGIRDLLDPRWRGR